MERYAKKKKIIHCYTVLTKPKNYISNLNTVYMFFPQLVGVGIHAKINFVSSNITSKCELFSEHPAPHLLIGNPRSVIAISFLVTIL